MITKLKKIKYLLIFFLSISLSYPTNLFSNKVINLLFHGGYAFETLGNQKNTAVYISIFNNSDKDVVIKEILSDIAEKVEIHEMIIVDNIMKMRMIKNFQVKKKSELYLQPGGKHILLFGLKKKIVDGDKFILKFRLENEEILESKVMVLSNKLRENLIN